MNNLELLDQPGESVCLVTPEGVQISYIPMDKSQTVTMGKLASILHVEQWGRTRPKSIEVSGA